MKKSIALFVAFFFFQITYGSYEKLVFLNKKNEISYIKLRKECKQKIVELENEKTLLFASRTTYREAFFDTTIIASFNFFLRHLVGISDVPGVVLSELISLTPYLLGKSNNRLSKKTRATLIELTGLSLFSNALSKKKLSMLSIAVPMVVRFLYGAMDTCEINIINSEIFSLLPPIQGSSEFIGNCGKLKQINREHRRTSELRD